MDYQLLIAKFRIKLKKVGKPLSYSGMTNLISDDYIVEVTNRLKGPDLVDRVPEVLWKQVHNSKW